LNESRRLLTTLPLARASHSRSVVGSRRQPIDPAHDSATFTFRGKRGWMTRTCRVSWARRDQQ
jgi:hypothetical protein